MEEEEVQPQPSSQMTSFRKPTTSPTIRFLGFFNEQESDSNSNPFELEESDVIWSPDFTDSTNLDSIDSNSPRLSTQSNSPTTNQFLHHSFRSEKFGLSAALSNDNHHPLVQRKPAFSPSFSNSAARMIPPISNPRSGSSSDDFSGSYSGKFHQSAPVNVPLWRKVNNGGVGGGGGSNNGSSAKLGFFEEEEEETEEEMLPPHEIVARSHSTTFSVFEGVGRTLKGRDLRRVRNAVWQKTGFLD